MRALVVLFLFVGGSFGHSAAKPKSSAAERSQFTSSKPWVNGLGMEFVSVPGTQVLFCRWETSRKHFAEFHGRASEKSKDKLENHPATHVSWSQAVAFCDWLTKREQKAGLIKKGQRYRLPRDVEWSKAVGMPEEKGENPYQRRQNAKSGGGVHHPNWSSKQNTLGGNYSDESAYDKYGSQGNRVFLHKMHKDFRYRDGFSDTAPVDAFKPNQFGIYNLGGNVAEWCHDEYGGPGFTSKQHYLRGGSFMDGYLPMTFSSSRMPINSPDEGKHAQHGFRVVLEMEASE